MPKVLWSLGHKGGALKWGQGLLQAEGHGVCAASSAGQTAAWAGWGQLATKKGKPQQAGQAPPQEGRVAPQGGGMERLARYGEP